jgi:hypothetical protein
MAKNVMRHVTNFTACIRRLNLLNREAYSGATNVVRIKEVMCSYVIFVSGNEQKMTLGRSSPV